MARHKRGCRVLRAAGAVAAAAVFTGVLPAVAVEAANEHQVREDETETLDWYKHRVAELKEALKMQRRSRFEPSHVTVPTEVSGSYSACRTSYYRSGANEAPVDLPIPVPKGCNEPRRRADQWTVPSFEELYFELYNQTWDLARNIFTEFSESFDIAKFGEIPYPYSVLQREDGEAHFREIVDRLGGKKLPSFVVEVGTFHGGSALYMAKYFDRLGGTAVPVMCVDPFTGDLNMWLNKNGWEFLRVRGGRPSIYEQFMFNVLSSLKEGLSPTHVLPFPVTSLVAARWLHLKGYSPDLVFLDSAHEVDETYMELVLFWRVLQPGGVLFGDDYRWPSVKKDLDRFVLNYHLDLTMLSEDVWYIVKESPNALPAGGTSTEEAASSQADLAEVKDDRASQDRSKQSQE